MNLQDVLDKVCNGTSDNLTSRKLGITRQMFSHYRTGYRLPSNEVLDKMAEIGELSAVEVYLAAYAERIDNPVVAEAFRNQSHLAA